MNEKNIGPFQVGGIVSPPYFVGRYKELKEMCNGLKSLSQNYLVISPRRVGKSSLSNAVKRSLEKEKNILAVYLNCRNVISKSTFGTKLIEETLKAYERKHRVSGFLEIFKRVMKGKILDAIRKIDKIGGSLSAIGEVYIKLREKEIDEHDYLEKAMDFIENFSKEKNKKTIVLIDEFQKLHDFDGAIFELFKSKIDMQEAVRYVITGSSIMLLQGVWWKKDSPLYMMFTKIYLEPFTLKTTANFVRKRLNKFNVKITDEALGTIYVRTGGIPYYVQKLGQFCFELSQRMGKSVDGDIVLVGFKRMLREFDEEFESRFLEKFSTKRQAILREVAKMNGARVSDIARSMNVDVNYLGESMHFLTESMVLRKEKRGYYDFFDPVFKFWLRKDL